MVGHYASLSQPHGALDHLAQRPGVVREARTAVEPAKPSDGTHHDRCDYLRGTVRDSHRAVDNRKLWQPRKFPIGHAWLVGLIL